VTEAETLVRRLYPALAVGDKDTLLATLAPDFSADLPDGFPRGIGGGRDSAEAMIRDTWWKIGALYSVKIDPRQWITTDDGRLLVVGRYVGRGRESGTDFDASFMHLWTTADGRVTNLEHCTDTALWAGAL
jgi:2-(1,2-epoxy-1,2-dihydrophenyl)acetyl-CoA isomerase